MRTLLLFRSSFCATVVTVSLVGVSVLAADPKTATTENESAATTSIAPIVPMVQPRALRLPMMMTTTRRSLEASFAALQFFDAHSTLRALSGGAYEANPLMSGIVAHPATFYALKAGTAAATVFLAERLGVRNPVATLLMMVGLDSTYVMIVAHNYGVVRR